jgi:hypothetical protein
LQTPLQAGEIIGPKGYDQDISFKQYMEGTTMYAIALVLILLVILPVALLPLAIEKFLSFEDLNKMGIRLEKAS